MGTCPKCNGTWFRRQKGAKLAGRPVIFICMDCGYVEGAEKHGYY